jgi:hypothetical protein
MQKLFLLFLALTISCNSSVSSSATKQEPVAELPKPTATPQIPEPSPLPTRKAQTKFSFNSHVGAAEMTSETEMCLVIPNDNLAEGDKVAAIFADYPKAQSLINAVVEKKLVKCGRKNHDVLSEVFYYSLKVVDGSYDFESEYQELNPVAIAFVGNPQPVNLKSGVASADLNSDGKVEYFRACTSNEGVHLTVWTGQPLKSKRQWHWYIDLSFDTVPSCKKKDYEA